jgi:NDP-sugar pyrophosphorylase family protein
MINVVIPAAGMGSRFRREGFNDPKPFIDVQGKSMIQRVLENLKIDNAHYILIFRKEDFIDYKEVLLKVLEDYSYTIVSVDRLTQGTACTVLHTIKSINNEDPLLIANSDQIVDLDLNRFINDAMERELDGSILTFHDIHEKWSYAQVDENGYVKEVREKQVISTHATVGIYYYSQGKDFVNAAVEMILHEDTVNNEYYTCPTYNYLVNSSKKIGIYEISQSSMHGIGTPEDLKIYLELLNVK